MDMDIIMLLKYFALFLTTYLTLKYIIIGNKHKKPLPPSPSFSLPIIGHFHLLKQPLHRSLAKLASQYGPILYLKLGYRRCLVVSSPEAVEECLIKNNVFLDRPDLLSSKHHMFGVPAIPWLPHGSHWRNLRRIATVEVLSVQRLQNLSGVRAHVAQAFIRRMMNEISSNGGSHIHTTVDMKSALFGLTLDNMMRMLVGKGTYEEEVDGKKKSEAFRRFQEIIEESFRVTGVSNMEDFLPILKWLKVLFPSVARGSERFKKVIAEKEAFMRELMDEHRELEKQGTLSDARQRSMLHVLLSLQKEDPKQYTDEMIGSLILTMFQGGTDTSASTTVWALSLLLNHPEVLKKAQAEIDANVGHGRLVEESDKPNLPYIQCIVNETFRMCPTGPLGLPYQSREDCEVGGYHVPKGSMLLYNVWAIHNDPKIWKEPRTYKPERFVGVEAPRLGHMFIPFGSGKRICPGENLASRVIWLAVAILVQVFEWERVSDELVDMREVAGVSLPKLEPLIAKCRPRPCMMDLISQL